MGRTLSLIELRLALAKGDLWLYALNSWAEMAHCRVARDAIRGGGTGSSLGCLMLERLSVDFGTKSMIGFTDWACPQFVTAVVKPYNSVVCVHFLLGYMDVSILQWRRQWQRNWQWLQP